MFGNNQDDAVKVFEFFSSNTNVEYFITGAQNGNSESYSITTSHLRGNDYLGTEMADVLDMHKILKYQFHTHYNGLGASIGDLSVQNRNSRSGALFGYFRPGIGYFDFNNNAINVLPW